MPASILKMSSTLSNYQIREHAAATGRVVADFDDLSVEETRICDSLIVKFSEMGGLDLTPNDATRRMLWGQVFSVWDSSMHVPEAPLKAPKRKRLELSLRIGTFRLNDVPKSAAAKRSEDGSVKVQEGRRAGQPVYIRPSLLDDDHGPARLRYDYVDKSGKFVRASLVLLDHDVNLSKAMSQSLRQYESDESKRVNDFNLEIITMWARTRLRAHLGLVDDDSTEAARLRLSAAAPRGERHSDLEWFVSPMAVDAEMKAISNAMVLRPVQGWTMPKN